MASPIKTEETMNLAEALRDDVSTTNFCDSGSEENINEEEDLKELRLMDLDPKFRALVVTKDSSTELIPTQHVASASESKDGALLLRDLNAGTDILDDDGKPVVGKVFSRVIQIQCDKSKHLSKGRRSRKDGDCYQQEKEKTSPVRPKPIKSGSKPRNSNDLLSPTVR